MRAKGLCRKFDQQARSSIRLIDRVEIGLKELGSADVEMFEILHRD